MKTAVEWFVEKIIHNGDEERYFSAEEIEILIKQAKQMEREQIENAYLIGCIRTMNDEETHPTNYYNEIYKNTNDEMD